MTYMTHDDHALGGLSIGQALSNLKANLTQRLSGLRAYRRTLNELAQLSESSLGELDANDD